MDRLIEALQIFLKYKNATYPTACEHDTLYIMEIERADVSDEDNDRLEKLGFFWNEADCCYMSFDFGSA
jgi:hypothetical protein